MIRLRWPDGSVTEGETWSSVEHTIRRAQWVPYNSHREFRRDMARRAKRWAGIMRPSIRGSAERFLRTLAAAEMFTVESDNSSSTSTQG